MKEKSNYKVLEVLGLFLKLGVIAFGGPAAHIALMQKEVIEKRKWMSEQHYLDLIGITSLVPGPNSTEMVMHCGKERAGIPGLFTAGFAFILPAVLITLFMAVLYQEYAHLPNVAPWIYGIKAGVIALIVSAIIKLSKKAVKGWALGVIGALALIAGLFGFNEILIILVAGLLNLGLKQFNIVPSIIAPLVIIGNVVSNKEIAITNMKIFLTFLKIGSVLFGSGYLLFAYLEAEFIENLGWLTYDQLAEAVAVGNITPGPVLSTATYVGYELNGFAGAGLATLGIFLPSFIIIMIISPFIPKLRKSKGARALINGINVGALAMMMAVTYKLGIELLVDWRSITIFVLAMLTMILYPKVNSVLFIVGCSLTGFLLQLISL